MIPQSYYNEEGFFTHSSIFSKYLNIENPVKIFESKENFLKLKSCCNNTAIFFEFFKDEKIQILNFNENGILDFSFTSQIHGKIFSQGSEEFPSESLLGKEKNYLITSLNGALHLSYIDLNKENPRVIHKGEFFDSLSTFEIKKIINIGKYDLIAVLYKPNPFKSQKIEIYSFETTGEKKLETFYYASWPISNSKQVIEWIYNLEEVEKLDGEGSYIYFFGYVEGGYGTVFRLDSKSMELTEMVNNRGYIGEMNDNFLYQFGDFKFGFVLENQDIMRVVNYH